MIINPHSRRTFLATLLGSAAAGFVQSRASAKPLPSEPAFFDFHCHPTHAQTLTDMKAAHLAGGFCCLVADMKIIRIENNRVRAYRTFEPGEAWKDYHSQLEMLKTLIKSSPVRLALSASDFATAGGTPSAYIGCEGCNFLEGKMDRLHTLYDDGVRLLQLVHYSQNDVGDLQTEEPVHQGLSKFGLDMVREMNAMGMLIDVAHASYPTARAVAEKTTKPIILSHTILEVAGKDVKRAISPDHAKAVTSTGGVIGMWPSGFNENLAAFVENTLRMIDVVGIDHVGLGTDMDGNYKPVIASYAEIKPWADALRAKGLSETDLVKLAAGNARRVLQATLR
jgi:membrane dipeptidase